MEDKTAAGATNNNANATNNDTFRVVLASVTNLLYPVDIDLIHYLFSKYGEIEKVSQQQTAYRYVWSPDGVQFLLLLARTPPHISGVVCMWFMLFCSVHVKMPAMLKSVKSSVLICSFII